MDRLLDQARQLLRDAEAALAAGQAPTLTTVLVAADGAIHVLTDSDWPLAALRESHAAASAFRIRRDGSSLCVEAQSRHHSVTLRSGRSEPPSLSSPFRDQPVTVAALTDTARLPTFHHAYTDR